MSIAIGAANILLFKNSFYVNFIDNFEAILVQQRIENIELWKRLRHRLIFNHILVALYFGLYTTYYLYQVTDYLTTLNHLFLGGVAYLTCLSSEKYIIIVLATS